MFCFGVLIFSSNQENIFIYWVSVLATSFFVYRLILYFHISEKRKIAEQQEVSIKTKLELLQVITNFLCSLLDGENTHNNVKIFVDGPGIELNLFNVHYYVLPDLEVHHFDPHKESDPKNEQAVWLANRLREIVEKGKP